MTTRQAKTPVEQGHSDPRLWPVILGLGATQIIGYGTIYYAFAIMAPAVGAEFSTSRAVLFGILSAGLFGAGLVAPRLGRLMDLYGAPRIMALGSAAISLLLAALAMAPGIVAYALLIVVLEAVSGAVLYNAAFATLALFGGTRARRAITHLTLIAGFASTLFWPLTGYLVDAVGFRATFGLFALLHLGGALPVHLLLVRAAGRLVTDPVSSLSDPRKPVAQFTPLSGDLARFAFGAIALSFALSAVVMAALGVHLVPVLQAMDLGAAAYLISMLMGPAQVLIRLTDALLWRDLHPLRVALISASAFPVAVLMLLLGLPALAAGCLFALMVGVGGGLSSIVQGTLPLALFGAANYGARLGRLAAARASFGAGAPFLFAYGVQHLGTAPTLWLSLGIGVLAVLPLIALGLRLQRAGALTPP